MIIYRISHDYHLIRYLFDESYIRKVKFLNFYIEKNFKRLEVILNQENKIFERLIDLLENNPKIKAEYLDFKDSLYYFDMQPAKHMIWL